MILNSKWNFLTVLCGFKKRLSNIVTWNVWQRSSPEQVKCSVPHLVKHRQLLFQRREVLIVVLTLFNRWAKLALFFTCPVFIFWNTTKCPHWKVWWTVKIHPPHCHPDAPFSTYKLRCLSLETVKRSKMIFTAPLIRFLLYLERKLGLKVRKMLSECWSE